MSDIVIRAENLGKQFHIGALQKYDTLRDRIAASFRRNAKSEGQNAKSEDSFWALKDVNFEINQGEVVGVIGRNGAGKSTLLKILSKITEPTVGRVELHGRVGSLLEVGTGFHPELTGRENIFLNGAILGMKRQEIKRRFDEIVAFSEVEKFIDTPVKHYSSGMYTRLAFAVAAHLDPEILLVDEVLAVGDAQFQKKCLGKMDEVAKGGRTVIFVSHNMQAVRQLCKRSLLLAEGKVTCDNNADVVIHAYLQDTKYSAGIDSIGETIQNLPRDPVFKLEQVIFKQGGKTINNVMNGNPLEISITYRVLEKTTGLRVFFDLYDTENVLIFRSFHDENTDGIQATPPGRYISKAIIPGDLLGPIGYIIGIQAGIYNQRMCLPIDAIRIPIEVNATGIYNKAYPMDTFKGKLAPAIKWITSVF